MISIVFDFKAIAQAQGNAAKILEDGKARAEGTLRLAESWRDAGSNARDIYLLQRLETLLKTLTAAVPDATVQNVTLVDSSSSNTATHSLSLSSKSAKPRTSTSPYCHSTNCPSTGASPSHDHHHHVLGLFPLALVLGQGSEFLQSLGMVVISGNGTHRVIIPSFCVALHDFFNQNRLKGRGKKS